MLLFVRSRRAALKIDCFLDEDAEKEEVEEDMEETIGYIDGLSTTSILTAVDVPPYPEEDDLTFRDAKELLLEEVELLPSFVLTVGQKETHLETDDKLSLLALMLK